MYTYLTLFTLGVLCFMPVFNSKKIDSVLHGADLGLTNSVLAQDLNPMPENATPNEVSKSKAQVPIAKDPETPARPVHPARRALIESLQVVQLKSRHNDDQYGESWRLKTEIYAIESGYPLTSGEQLLEEFAKKGKRRRLLLGGLALVPSATYYAAAASLSTAHPAHLQLAGALSIGSAVVMLKPSQAEHTFNISTNTNGTSSTRHNRPIQHPTKPNDTTHKTVPKFTERPCWRLLFAIRHQESSATLVLHEVQWKTVREQLNRWEEYLDKYPETAFRPRIEANMRAADRLMAQAHAEKKRACPTHQRLQPNWT